MEWNVKNAVNRDVERQHLNKILKEIRAAIDSLSSSDASGENATDEHVRLVVADMVSNNYEYGLSVTFNPDNGTLDFQANDFTINLTGDVTGSGQVSGLSGTTIATKIDPSVVGIPDVPNDGQPYWRTWREWQRVAAGLEQLDSLTTTGFMVKVYDSNEADHTWVSRQLGVDAGELTIDNADGALGNPVLGLADVTPGVGGVLKAFDTDQFGRVDEMHDITITGTAGQIDVANGTGASGDPTISLADLADTGVGSSLVKITRDAKGRVEGTEAATTDDLPEGATNFYYTDARADARIELQKGQPNGLATLDGSGKLDGGQLPALAITETFVVSDESAMLALTAQQGDVAVRTDNDTTYILTAEPASTLANWQELLSPTAGAVTSFNGRTGNVVPESGDYTPAQVGADPTGTAAAAVAAHVAEADPHPQYTTASEAAAAAPVQSVNGSTGAVSVTPASIGAEPAISTGTTAQYISGAKTLRTFAADVRASVLTGLSTATNAAITATDTVLQALGKLQAHAQASLVIDGMMMRWDGSSSITITSGQCYAENGTLIVLAADTAVSMPTLAANTWYHIYAAIVSGTPGVVARTDTPIIYRGRARSRTSFPDQRYLGSFRTNGSAGIYGFVHTGNIVLYNAPTGSAPFRVLSAGFATVQTSVDCSPVVPVSAVALQARLINLTQNGAVLSVGNDSEPTIAQLTGTPSGSTTSETTVILPANASQAITYQYNVAPSGSPNRAYIDVSGYFFDR